jgi:molecular chaperone HscC
VIIGIDLGTTNSLVSVWQDGQARLIPNSLGELLTPSCVSIDEDGSILVGRAARERLQTHPLQSAAVFKRFMGSNKTLKLGERAFRPEELSALVLKSLKADAEAALGEVVTEAVITVPAYFSEAQRRATRIAGQIAGLKVDRLLNEPTAAALAYGMHDLGNESRFLVFDLGGGTFDVSILELFDGVMEVRATAGDNLLGGEDFLSAMVDHFFDQAQVPSTLKQDVLFMQRLFGQVEQAKRHLSTHPEADVRLHHGGEEYAFKFTEPVFETICASLLKRLRTPVERAMRDANLRSSELDQVVLAGGATRMPMIRRLVTTMFGRFPSVSINPDEVVGLGAAVQAGLKAKDISLEEVVMTDVCPYSLGVGVSMRLSERQTLVGHFDPIIERNTPVPVSRTKRYVPMNEGQALIILQIYQGEARMVKDNVSLGQLPVELPQGPIEDCAVDVRFTYDVNGLLQVEATPTKTGQTTSLIIEGNPGVLSEKEIAACFAALADLKIHPRDRMENRTTMAHAERLYSMLRGEVREWLAMQIIQFEILLETQNPKLIRSGRKHFNMLLDKIDRDGSIQDSDIDHPT